MTQALFEVPFDAASRLPLLPRSADTGDFTLFEGSPVQGWCLCYDVSDTPATVTVRIATSPAALIDLKADPSLLWLGDVGSPIKEKSLSAADAVQAESWLKSQGWNKPKDKTATDKVKAARKMRDLAQVIIEDLHGARLDQVERMQIGEEQ